MLTVTRIAGSFAGEVSGLDLTKDLDRETVAQIRSFIGEFPVLCFRDQPLDDARQKHFAAAFGPLLVNELPELGGKADGSEHLLNVATVNAEGETIAPDSIQGKMAAANLLWHTDGSQLNPPVRFTTLSARILPSSPPPTEYADMREAWDRLPSATRQSLEGLEVEHDILVSRAKTGMTADQFEPETLRKLKPTVQPLVRTNQHTGRKALYLASHASHVIGRPVEEGRALIENLTQHATDPAYVYRHQWQPGDLMMWDDFATMHRGTEYDGREPRFLRWCGVLAA